MYNQLLSVGHVPCELLVAHIVPVHKKGITTDVSNYRPISLTCVLSKIRERIVVGRLSGHLERNIFCILLNTVSLNIAPLALTFLRISMRISMTGVSLCNPRNRLQLFILISPKPLTWFLTRNCLLNYTLMVSVVMFYYGCIFFSLVVHYRQKSTPVYLRLRT